jgi:hypothetical protein
MKPTGPRSHIRTESGRSGRGRTLRSSAVALIGIVAAFLAPVGAQALDLFTFWNDPDIALAADAGDWALYRMVTLDAGRRTEDLVRFRCDAVDDDGWRLTVYPVVENDEGFFDVPSDAWSFTLGRGATTDAASLADYVSDVIRMIDGEPRSIADREWKEDPLLNASLGDGFAPDVREPTGDTTRVVGGRDLLCAGLKLASTDSTRIELPRGVLLQIHTRDVSVALHDDVPFLGVVFASERGETRSELDPPGRRRQPPPRQRIETMELIEFGVAGTGSRAGG